jgi:biopolymer transport protein ExbB/TolQ
MTSNKTYLTRMVLFLVAVGLGCALIAPALANIFLVNPLLNGAIMAVIVVGIALNFRQVLQLAPEMRWVENFRASATTDVSMLAEQRTDTSTEKIQLLSPMARMLADKRGRGRLSLSAPALRTVLDGIASRLNESRDLCRYFTSLCIFLGLLGTFWGLLGTINAVGDVIKSLSVTGTDMAAMFDDLKAGLEAPLSGMGTAFSSSLFGLAGSLVLGFLDLQAGQAQNSFFNDLEEWLAGLTRLSSGAGASDGEQSIPAYTEALLEQTAESLDELQRTLAKAEQGRLAANEHFVAMNEKLTILTDQMRTETQVLLRLAENQKELTPILKRINEAPTPTGGGFDEATRAHIRNIDMALSRLGTTMDAGREALVRDMRSEIKLLAKTIAASSAAGNTPPREDLTANS